MLIFPHKINSRAYAIKSIVHYRQAQKVSGLSMGGYYPFSSTIHKQHFKRIMATDIFFVGSMSSRYPIVAVYSTLHSKSRKSST